MTDHKYQENEFIAKANNITDSDSTDLGWEDTLEEIFQTVIEKKSLILYGPPGTGKTKITYDLMDKLKQQNLLGKVEIVQFHHKFSYEDFIEGYSPNENGSFNKRDGIFKKFIKSPSPADKIDIFFIDEINRADITTTFGELLFLMDDKNSRKVKTSHFDEEISLPENTVIIGTMNTADRNIGIIDFALRRRFKFIPLSTDYAVLLQNVSTRGFTDSEISAEEFVKTARIINERIATNRLMGRHMELGHAMWFPSGKGQISEKNLTELFRFSILPQLEAYCGYGHEQQLKSMLNEHMSTLYLTNKHIAYEDVKGLIKDISNKSK
jgi:5-methylcytosine-specific restriction protein B